MCHGIDHHANDMYHMDIFWGPLVGKSWKIEFLFQKQRAWLIILSSVYIITIWGQN